MKNHIYFSLPLATAVMAIFLFHGLTHGVAAGPAVQQGRLQVKGVFLGCAVGQGILGCGIRGDDGVEYNFDDQSTPAPIMNGIGDWENKRVVLDGNMQDKGENSAFLIVTSITLEGKAAPMATRLLGVWQNSEDLHYSVAFLPQGVRLESVEDTEATSRYGLFRECNAPLHQSDPSGKYLKVWNDNAFNHARCSSIDALTSDRLTLTYLSGERATVVYTRQSVE